MPEEVTQAVQISEYIRIVAIVLGGCGGLWLLKVIVQRLVVNSIDWFIRTNASIQELKTKVAVLETESAEIKQDLKDVAKTVKRLTDASKKQYEDTAQDISNVKADTFFIRGWIEGQATKDN